MTREPQVGDVAYYMWQLVVVLAVDRISACIKVRVIQRLWWYEVYQVISKPENMTYAWKLAPRYKRLFWIYFIPDKPND